MNPARYAIKYKTVTLLFSIILILGGIVAYFKIGRLEDPEFTIKEAVIFTYYPGATALEVEQEVTDQLETAIQQLKQLKEVRSISRSGVSIIFAEMKEIYDKDTLPQVWDELRRKIKDVEGNLPAGCKEPYINDDFGDVYGVFFAITGDGYSKHILKDIAEDLRKELLLCSDVGKIDFWGLPEEAIYIEIDRAKLTQLGIQPNSIFSAVTNQNTVTYAGETKVASKDIHFRISGDYTNITDLGEQLIQGSNGKLFHLKDIAEIKFGFTEPAEKIIKRNGKYAIGLGISTVSGGNVIAMGDSINARLDKLRAKIPAGIKIIPIAHQGDTVRKAVNGFILNLLSAIIIVILLLIVFMGLREGIIIGVVLLLTIMTTLLCMYALDITLQRISLGALIIALGMLVDNAIVVAEGIVIKANKGLNRIKAAEETVHETMWPLLGATGIAILAFAAISLSKDMTGEWLISLFQVICISLGLSWLFAITITPYLCVTFLSHDNEIRQNSYNNWFYSYYRKFVSWCIWHKKTTLIFVGLILFCAMTAFTLIKQDFMPYMNRNQFTVDLWFPQGTHIDHTEAEMQKIQNYISTLEGVKDVTSFIGAGSLRFLLTYSPEMPDQAYGMMLVDVTDFREIPKLTGDVMTYINHNFSEIVTTADSFKLGPGGGMIEARISGYENSVLRDWASAIKAIMQQEPNARTIRTNWGNQVQIEAMELARSRAQSISITRSEIAQATAMNFSGSTVGMYRQGTDLLPIIVRSPEDERKSIEKINDIQIWTSGISKWLPLEQGIKGISVKWEDPVIRRLNRQRTISVLCKPVKGTTEALFKKLKPKIEAISKPEGYELEWGGEHEAAEEANSKLMGNFPIAFIAMFLISVILFNSIKHPLIIFMGLPLIMVGVAPAMLIANKAFGFMAMLGFLSLFGMLIKNEIVLLDQINLELSQGKKQYQAIIDSAVSRVRPVTMAAFTTVLGMAPLLWDAFFSPMAVTIMGGLTFATILILVVIPVLYATVFRVHKNSL